MMGVRLDRFFLIMLLIGSFIGFPSAARAFEIQRTEFVVGISNGNFEPVYSPSKVVPLLPDRACFGWRIRISGDEKLVFTREILKLPEQPEYWSGEDDAYDHLPDFRRQDDGNDRRISSGQERVDRKLLVCLRRRPDRGLPA